MIAIGDCVIVPDPQQINPFGGSAQPHGQGRVAEIKAPKYPGGQRMVRVELNGGETVTVGELFLRPLTQTRGQR